MIEGSLKNISLRKKEHLELCLTKDVAFKNKINGFEYYDFKHNAITEVEVDKINFETKFLKKKVNLPFLISCMTGGTSESENINAQLAVVAEDLKIPIGVGSQRQAIEDPQHRKSYDIIRKNAPTVPILANIGAAEIISFNSLKPFRSMIDMIEANGLVIHLNPAQELLQPEGNPNFKGILKKMKKIVKDLGIPVIAKEVGAGISAEAAERLLEIGIKGIDVAGAGGTSWTGVEILRSGFSRDHELWDWGLPTAFCIKEVGKLKRKYKFTLIGSGGINSGMEAAKAFALGSDLVASARLVLQNLNENGIEGVKKMILAWFDVIKHVMFLTGSQKISQLNKNKIIRKDRMY